MTWNSIEAEHHAPKNRVFTYVDGLGHFQVSRLVEQENCTKHIEPATNWQELERDAASYCRKRGWGSSPFEQLPTLRTLADRAQWKTHELPSQ